MNVGTIIDNSNLKVKLKKLKTLGFVDESFILSIKCGDTFRFSGLKSSLQFNKFRRNIC